MADTSKPSRAWGTGSVFKRGPFYCIRWYDGLRYRSKNTHTTSRTEAEKMLRAELEAKSRGANPDAHRVTFKDLIALRADDRAVRGLPVEEMSKRLVAAFGNARAKQITSAAILRYERERLDQHGAARATVNNELACLRRMFNLAVEKRLLSRDDVPVIHTPDPHNARQGFFEPDDFDAVLRELPESFRAPFRFGYFTGWRVRSEVLTLQWKQVDFAAGTVRLEPGTTKNKEGRTFPFSALPALMTLLEEQHAATKALERKTKQVIPWVFHRGGNPLWEYGKTWKRACRRAAYEGKGKLREVVRPHLLERPPLVHDLRRTAVRNLERAGVPRSVAMKLTGHKTESVYRRYAIVCERDLAEGVAKLAKLSA